MNKTTKSKPARNKIDVAALHKAVSNAEATFMSARQKAMHAEPSAMAAFDSAKLGRALDRYHDERSKAVKRLREYVTPTWFKHSSDCCCCSDDDATCDTWTFHVVLHVRVRDRRHPASPELSSVPSSTRAFHAPVRVKS